MSKFYPLLILFSLFASVGFADAPKETFQTGEKVDEQNEEILQRLEPFYFAYGKNEIKIQASFKTPVVRTVPLYLGYTQLMFYDFDRAGSGFRDLTYNPSMFYQMKTEHAGSLKSMDFGILDHSSNGRPLLEHRSLNKSYFRTNFEFQGNDWLTRFSTQVQGIWGLEKNNPDIQEYIGPLVFKISFIQLFKRWIDKSEVSFQATPGGRWADQWSYGGYQLAWSFRLGGINLVPAFYMQYYSGFAESLLNYNVRVNSFRAGMIF